MSKSTQTTEPFIHTQPSLDINHNTRVLTLRRTNLYVLVRTSMKLEPQIAYKITEHNKP